ncbi:MAG TPA: hypothetical protein VF993_10735 [Myxococcales bacterium]
MKRAAAFLLAVALAQPALAARPRHRRPPLPPAVRPEDDRRLKGEAKAFAKARVSFSAPQDLAQLEADAPVKIGLQISGYALGALHPGGPVPHAHLIVDNAPAMQIDDASAPLALKGLGRGPHLLRAVLCRPWHEVLKGPKAFAMVRIWIGPRLVGKPGKAAESVAWPDPKKPILTYVLPAGSAGEQLELEGAADPPPGSDHPVLDFYLANSRLARRGDKVRVVLDRRELPLITAWKPLRLRRTRIGAHRITIDLLNRRGQQVKNIVNRTDRSFEISRSRPASPPSPSR